MAEGFIKEAAGQRSLEKEGEYYLMDLIDRNLLIVADKSSNGGVKSCRLHDLLREVCLKKAFEENFFMRVSIPTSKRNIGSDSGSSIVKQRLFTDQVLWGINQNYFASHTRFPETLRKLTLLGTRLHWNYMSTVQQLPKLEVLKLLFDSFMGDLWDIGDEQFQQLKYLELSVLNIRVWNAFSSNFPRLRKLAVRRCLDLSEIPLVLGYISTLEEIEIDDSNTHVVDSVNRIQEAQREIGNCDIHVNIINRFSNYHLF
ncbi:putative disease resistance RPP8-like protein 2 [Bidens hawaiensis]|uniref:putative disease resistance RPP8-like protein 2 n=1 Tax=Bidens hawaiensis TaxID=980011 RepID=UPI00404AF1BE